MLSRPEETSSRSEYGRTVWRSKVTTKRTSVGLEEKVERISVPRDGELRSLGPDDGALLDLGRVRNAAVAKSDGGHQEDHYPCCQDAYKYIKNNRDSR